METIDLSDPQALRRFIVGDTPAFITEINNGDDSDIELDDEETGGGGGLPIHQGSLVDTDTDSDSEDDNNDTTERRWREGATAPPHVTFTGDRGLQVDLPDDPTPLDYFRLMVTDEMVENMVTETNRYAADSMRDKVLSPQSRFHKWVDVIVPEMWAFLGLIGMGLIVVDDLEEYWSTDPAYNLPLFRSIMARDRFCVIMSFFHLNDNNGQPPRDDPNHDPLYKLRGFVDALTGNFRRTFLPGPRIAIDEAMVAWRGHLSFRVYNPDKPSKFGIKAFELCDSDTGYCCDLEFYTGRRVASPMGATFDVVNRLIDPYLGCGRTLYVDNYYTSPDLFTFLRRNNTLACGTLRLNRRNGPPKTMIPKLRKTETAPKALTDGTLNLLRFHDKREVNILTTAHDARMIRTGRDNPVMQEPIVKLKAVHDYNKYMGAVDRSDQMATYNAFKRRTLKWWKKTFFHLFMLGVVNAYIIHTASATKKLTHRIFWRDLTKLLVAMVPLAIPRPRLVEVGDTSLLRLTARHFPDMVPPKPKPGTNPVEMYNSQRECPVCAKPGKRKARTRYECRSCDT